MDWQKIIGHLKGVTVTPILNDFLTGQVGFAVRVTQPQPMECQIRYDWRKHKWQYRKGDKWMALTSRTKLIT
jgi:hypothetical protein